MPRPDEALRTEPNAANAALLLGIDIGGTKIAGGLIDAQTGKLISHQRVPTLAQNGGPVVLQRALDLAQTLIDKERMRTGRIPQAVGIGAGGQINAQTGVVLSATDLLPGWAGTHLAGAFSERFNLPAVADNDVHALAVGEQIWGAGRGLQNLVYIALGTGVGGAIISNGKLHRSPTGVSGEIGHLIVDPNGPLTNSGTRGSLEEYASGPALHRLYRELGGEGEEATDGKKEPLACQACADRNSPAGRACTQTGAWLGIALVSLAHLFGPDAFIIGGGLASLGDLLLEPARHVLRKRALPPVKETPVVTAALGPNASVIGAAALALPHVSLEGV